MGAGSLGPLVSKPHKGYRSGYRSGFAQGIFLGPNRIHIFEPPIPIPRPPHTHTPTHAHAHVLDPHHRNDGRLEWVLVKSSVYMGNGWLSCALMPTRTSRVWAAKISARYAINARHAHFAGVGCQDQRAVRDQRSARALHRCACQGSSRRRRYSLATRTMGLRFPQERTASSYSRLGDTLIWAMAGLGVL